jgi:penicillin-binding protein 2
VLLSPATVRIGRPALGALVTLAVAFSLFATPGAEARARKSARVKRSSHISRGPALRSFFVPPLVLSGDASPRDREVGEACLRALGKRRGSVVAMEPRTGRVIALVNPDVGFFQAYTPCSVFKIVVAIAGLTEGVITPQTLYNCNGGCWTWPGHGPIDLRRALAVSCNPYFEWIGERLGYEKIERYARLLGLGEVSGINLTGECAGKLPESVKPERVGRLSSHATGVATSVVQIAVLLSATINGGVVYQPQIAGPGTFVPKERWRLPQGTVLDGLSDGFLAAVNEGSAITAFDPDVVVAGKTGSCSRLGWFASYLVADKNEMVVVVFLRPGNGHLASTIAGQIYQELYKPAVAGGSAVTTARPVPETAGGL